MIVQWINTYALSVKRRLFEMKFPILIFFALCSADRILGYVGFNGTRQDWGFVNVRPGANLFWWLYYTTANVDNPFQRPLIIWLEGGPGVSGTGFGNFYQIGPIDIDGNARNYSWVEDYNVLYIDHPVGTGFSHANDTTDLVTNNLEAASDIFNCIQEFLLQIPEFQTVPTYVVGESYGGQVCPKLASIWYQAEKKTAISSTLKGVLLISPWVSPIDSTATWAAYLLATARIDSNGYDLINEAVTPVQVAIDEGRWGDATMEWSNVEKAVLNATGALYFNNVLSKIRYPFNYSASIIANLDLFMNGPVKDVLRLDINWSMDKNLIFGAMAEDFMRPVVGDVEYLLNDSDLKIVVAAAQLDVIVNNIGTVQWIEKLEWLDIENWQNAGHDPVYVDEIIEAYCKRFGNFSLYWVLRSGHTIASDDPAATRAMLQDLTSNSD